MRKSFRHYALYRMMKFSYSEMAPKVVTGKAGRTPSAKGRMGRADHISTRLVALAVKFQRNGVHLTQTLHQIQARRP